MNREIKKIKFFILFIFIVSSCSKNIVNDGVSIKTINNDEKIKVKIEKNVISLNSDNLSDGKKLKIGDSCIGCWKCVMVDPSHFSINMAKFKADVILQKDIDSYKVEEAINVCPMGCISIS